MITVSKFKANFLALFRLMRDTGMYVDVTNYNRVYRITVEDMGYSVPSKRKKKSYTGAIETTSCPKCGKLMISGVCMNAKCSHSA